MINDIITNRTIRGMIEISKYIMLIPENTTITKNLNHIIKMESNNIRISVLKRKEHTLKIINNNISIENNNNHQHPSYLSWKNYSNIYKVVV